LRLFRAHRRLRDGLREQLRNKRRPVAARPASRAAKSVASGRQEDFLTLAAQAEYACGD
jgi:hypothetical protein